MKLKRIATVAALALLAVGGMSACRVESGAALFVQNQRIDESRVDDIVADAPKNPETGELKDSAEARQNVIGWLTTVELAKRVSTDTHVPLPGPQYGDDQNDSYARLNAEADAYIPILLTGATPVEATQVDAQKIADYITGQTGQDSPGLADAILPILQGPEVALALGQRAQVEALCDKYDVVANPRYGNPGVQIVAFQLNSGRLLPITAPIPTGSTS